MAEDILTAERTAAEAADHLDRVHALAIAATPASKK